MFDQSFNAASLSRMLKKSDFLRFPRLREPDFRSGLLIQAAERAREGYVERDFLHVSALRGKRVYRATDMRDVLILRKIDSNLQGSFKLRKSRRDDIIENMKHLLSEAVPYRVYRLDISAFYESFTPALITAELDRNQILSERTKIVISQILEQHIAGGGVGLPRGLSLSGTLSEIIMRGFDRAVEHDPDVFFYARYVDDIVVITSFLESPACFLKRLRSALPKGLHFNPQKTSIHACPTESKKYKASPTTFPESFSFEYLGYQLSVTQPTSSDNALRPVTLDIANSKVRKIKTRITKAFQSFSSNRDFELLVARLKFLASNFSMLDADRERVRLAGIYYNYHLINPDAQKALGTLDMYLRKAALSASGPIFERFYDVTTPEQRRKILAFSFVAGFKNKTFYHFSHEKITRIQKCWKYV